MSLNYRRRNGVLTTEHTEKFILLEYLRRIIVKIAHHLIRRGARLEFFERMDADLIDLRVRFFLIKLHIARSIDDGHRTGSGSGAIRNRTLVRDGKYKDSGGIFRRIFVFVN